MAEPIITEPEESNQTSQTDIAQPVANDIKQEADNDQDPFEPFGSGRLEFGAKPSEVVKKEAKYGWEKDLQYAKDIQGVNVVRLPVTGPSGTKHVLEYERNRLESNPTWRDFLQTEVDTYQQFGADSNEFLKGSASAPIDSHTGKPSTSYAFQHSKKRQPIPKDPNKPPVVDGRKLLSRYMREEPSLMKWAKRLGGFGQPDKGFIGVGGFGVGEQTPITRENAPLVYEELLQELNSEWTPVVMGTVASVVAGLVTTGASIPTSVRYLMTMIPTGLSTGLGEYIRGASQVLLGDPDKPETGLQAWRRAFMSGSYDAMAEGLAGKFADVVKALPINAKAAITERGRHYQSMLEDLLADVPAADGGTGGMITSMGKSLGEGSANMLGKDVNIALTPAQMAEKAGVLQTIDEILTYGFFGGRGPRLKQRTFKYLNDKVNSMADAYVKNIDNLYGEGNKMLVLKKIISGEIDLHAVIAKNAEKHVVDVIDGIPALDDAGNVLAGRWMQKGVASDTGVDISHLLTDKDNKRMINLIIKDHLLTQPAEDGVKLITRPMDEVLKNGRYLSARDAIKLRSKLGQKSYEEFAEKAGFSMKGLKNDVHKAIDDLLPEGYAKDQFALRQDEWVQVFKKREIESMVIEAGTTLDGPSLLDGVKPQELEALVNILKGRDLAIGRVKLRESEALPVLKSLLINDLVSSASKSGRFAEQAGKIEGAKVYEHLFGRGTRGALIREEKLQHLFTSAEINELENVIGLLEFVQMPKAHRFPGTAIQFAQIAPAGLLAGITLEKIAFSDEELSDNQFRAALASGMIVFGPAALARLWVRPAGRKLLMDSLTNNAKGNIQTSVNLMRRAMMLDQRLMEGHIAEHEDRMEGRIPTLREKHGWEHPLVRTGSLSRQQQRELKRMVELRRSQDPNTIDKFYDTVTSFPGQAVDVLNQAIGNVADTLYPGQLLTEEQLGTAEELVNRLKVEGGQTPLGPLPPRQ